MNVTVVYIEAIFRFHTKDPRRLRLSRKEVVIDQPVPTSRDFVGQQVVVLLLVAGLYILSTLKLNYMSNKVNTSFNRGRDGDLVNDGFRAVDHMTDNAFFPTPNPSVAELKQATQEYQQALYDAAGRDQQLVAIKDNRRAVLRSMLSRMAEYVTSVANGNREILLSSGFKLARNREADDLKPIGELEVCTDAPEQAITRINRVPGAKAYVHEYTTGVVTNESVW
jgi:hypothetical protein